jgi:hypothetical protein
LLLLLLELLSCPDATFDVVGLRVALTCDVLGVDVAPERDVVAPTLVLEVVVAGFELLLLDTALLRDVVTLLRDVVTLLRDVVTLLRDVPTFDVPLTDVLEPLVTLVFLAVFELAEPGAVRVTLTALEPVDSERVVVDTEPPLFLIDDEDVAEPLLPVSVVMAPDAPVSLRDP